MFDTDTFVADCIAARAESEPRLAIRDVLARALARPEALADTFKPSHAGLTRLHVSPELTVLNLVWAPHMVLKPHDHRMWATIGIYTAGEDNTFYRRQQGTITESGGKELRPGDVCLLGDDTIHSVTNPTDKWAGAIHVYGGDFFETPRSEWDPETRTEKPFDVDGLLRHFEESNRLAAEMNDSTRRKQDGAA